MKLLATITGLLLCTAAVEADMHSAVATSRASARVLVPLAVVGDEAGPYTFNLAAHARRPDGMADTALVTEGGQTYLPELQQHEVVTLSLSAEASSWYAVTLPRTDLFQVSNGNSQITLDSALSTEKAAGYLNHSGRETVTIHARLAPLVTPAKGRYMGTFEVTLERN